MPNYPAWIGVGARFPKFFSEVTKGVDISKDLERINQSIMMILKTPIGSLFFLPEFGSDLHKLIFEQNDYVLFDLLRLYTVEAITRWEKRIVITEASITSGDNKHVANVVINYRLANSNVLGNLVYPFYRQVT